MPRQVGARDWREGARRSTLGGVRTLIAPAIGGGFAAPRRLRPCVRPAAVACSGLAGEELDSLLGLATGFGGETAGRSPVSAESSMTS